MTVRAKTPMPEGTMMIFPEFCFFMTGKTDRQPWIFPFFPAGRTPPLFLFDTEENLGHGRKEGVGVGIQGLIYFIWTDLRGAGHPVISSDTDPIGEDEKIRVRDGVADALFFGAWSRLDHQAPQQ